jgi:hypothetical protein
MKTSAWRLLVRLLIAALVLAGSVVLYAGQRFKATAQPTDGTEVYSDTFERAQVGTAYIQGQSDLGHKTVLW